MCMRTVCLAVVSVSDTDSRLQFGIKFSMQLPCAIQIDELSDSGAVASVTSICPKSNR